MDNNIVSGNSRGPGVANAFGFSLPEVGDEIILPWEAGPTRKFPDENRIKARHPSGCWIFLDRASQIIPKPGEKAKCRITRIIENLDNGSSCCYGFALVLEILISQPITRPRLSPILAEALLLGIDIKKQGIQETLQGLDTEYINLRNEVETLNSVLREKNARLEQMELQIDEMKGNIQALEHGKNEYENHIVTDEVKPDDTLEAGPSLE